MSRESQIGFLLICFPLLHYYGFLTPTWGPAQRQPVLEISPFAAQEARTLFAQKRSIISSPNAAFRSLSSRSKSFGFCIFRAEAVIFIRVLGLQQEVSCRV